MKNFNPRRVGSLFLLIMVLFFSFPTHGQGAEPDQYLRIGLYYGETAKNSYTITSTTGFMLGSATTEGFSPTLPLPAYTALTATIEGSYVVLRGNNGELISSDIGINGCIYPLGDTAGVGIALDTKAYRGGFLFMVSQSGKLNAINHVTMEEYLYGVLHKEMSQSNPLEALKAQAVAARSYAALNTGRHSSEGFELCATTHCQVYDGKAAEYPSTVQAVNETSGLKIYEGLEPVVGYYHKNSGGHTQNSAEVWSATAGYLSGKPDPYSPSYPWSNTMTFDFLKTKLEAAGHDPGSIRSVRIGGRNSASAVASLIIDGSNGAVTLEKERIRAVLGTTLIRSRHFVIGITYPDIKGTGSENVAITLINDKESSKASNSVYVLSANGSASLKPLNDLYLTNGTKTMTPVILPTEDPIFDDSIPATGDKVTFSGQGFGHGVGMSQDGAIAMAKMGFDFKQILNFYYTGIEVK